MGFYFKFPHFSLIYFPHFPQILKHKYKRFAADLQRKGFYGWTLNKYGVKLRSNASLDFSRLFFFTCIGSIY